MFWNDNLHLHIFVLCSNIKALFGGNYIFYLRTLVAARMQGVPCEKGR